MFQKNNVYKKAMERYSRIRATDLVAEGNKIWLSLSEGNGLAETDLLTGKVRILCTFEEAQSSNLYGSIAKVENHLLLVPEGAQKIVIYDLDAGRLHGIDLEPVEPGRKEVYNPGAKFGGYYTDMEHVFLTGNYYPAIVKVNIRTHEVSYLTEWVSEIEKYLSPRDCRGYIGRGYVRFNRCVYFPLQCCPAILILHLDTLCTEVKIIDSPLEGIASIMETDGEIWLQGKGASAGAFVKMNRRWEVLEKIAPVETMRHIPMSDYRIMFWNPVMAGEKMILFPSVASGIYERDKKSGQIKRSGWNVLTENGESCMYTVYFAKEIENKIYFLTGWDRILHVYDIASGRLEDKDIQMDHACVERQMASMWAECVRTGSVAYERDISVYCLTESGIHRSERNGEAAEIKTGQIIYETLRAEL